MNHFSSRFSSGWFFSSQRRMHLQPLFLSAWVLALLALPLSGQAQAIAPQIADEIVAVVNNDIITRNELHTRTAVVEKNLKSQGSQLPSQDVLEKQVLERMIIEKIEIQNALDYGMRVDDSQLDRAIARIAEQNGQSVQALRNRVESEGMAFTKFRDDVRNEIMMSRLRDKEVDSKLQVAEGEIDNFLAEQAKVSAATSEINLAQILIRVPEQATAVQIENQRQRADGIYKQLVGGADFAKLAASFSDAPEGIKGGDLGWRPSDRLPQIFADAVAPLTPGQITQPIKSPNGFHILKLVAKRTGGAGDQGGQGAFGPVQQTHARHILIKTSEVVSSAQAKQRLLDIKQRLDNKSTSFEEMAKAYSNDGSASRGGDLGTLYPGDTVPEFERAMNALKIDEISEPVQSQFGWHLIQVLERKNQDLSADRMRQLARQALHERKSDEAYDDWLRSIRDRAYVEYRLEDKG